MTQLMKHSMTSLATTDDDNEDKRQQSRVYAKNSMDRFGDDLCALLLSYFPLEDRFRYECVSKQFQRTLFESVVDITINDTLLCKAARNYRESQSLATIAIKHYHHSRALPKTHHLLVHRVMDNTREPIVIDGIEVHFPYKPYGLQLDYMRSMIRCCQQKQNGLLESPTGTGKTLCILCSSLAWIRYQRLLLHKPTPRDPFDDILSQFLDELWNPVVETATTSAAIQRLDEMWNPVVETATTTSAAISIEQKPVVFDTDIVNMKEECFDVQVFDNHFDNSFDEHLVVKTIDETNESLMTSDDDSMITNDDSKPEVITIEDSPPEVSSQVITIDDSPPEVVPEVEAEIGSNDGREPQIVYTSRTHSQLSQSCRQLKQTEYRTEPAVVMASREQLCLCPQVQSQSGPSMQSQMCSKLTKNDECQYYPNIQGKVDRNIETYYKSRNGCKVMDIEDLVDFGRRHECCPYYAARKLADKASVLFMPYNYVIEPRIRHAMKLTKALRVKNSVIVFDEGHNIEDRFADAMSTHISGQTLDTCIKQLHSIGEWMQRTPEEKVNDRFKCDAQYNINRVLELSSKLCELQKLIF
ncbi:unnamed protein product, partial [Medioppia subpectinata]